MSKLSIYETRWLNLVFENKNKMYGAYQLRQESTKTSLLALFLGILLLSVAANIPRIITYFYPTNIEVETPLDYTTTIVQLSTIHQQKVEQKKELPAVKTKTVETLIVKNQFVNPTIVKAELATQEIAKNVESTVVTSTNDGAGIVGVNPSTGSGEGVVNTSSAAVGNEIINSVALDKLPEFPGGINKFYSYVGNNFEKPEIDNTGSMKIYVSFVIERDGSMTDIQVKRDPGFGLGKEAIRVLKSLKTKWAPGMINGQAVRTAYNLPITVQME